MSQDATMFFDGALMMAFSVSGLFFLRFWSRTRDRLFLFFSLAFFIMAINRIALAMIERGSAPNEETHAVLYLIRLVAFTLIVIGIVDKNRSGRSAPGDRSPGREP